MKRLIMILSAILLIGMAGALPANAQLGKILKKAKSTIESVGGTTNDGKQLLAKEVETPIPSGGTMLNPLKNIVDIELVGFYGVSTSQNYGYVYPVFKIKMIANKSEIKFGGMVNNVTAIAVDQDGNTYKTNGPGWYAKQVAEGMVVKVVVDESSTRFKDVKKTAKTLQLVRLGASVDYQNQGVLTFKNGPIIWDQEPQ